MRRPVGVKKTLQSRRSREERVPTRASLSFFLNKSKTRQGAAGIRQCTSLLQAPLPYRLASLLAFFAVRSSVLCKHHRNTAPPSEPGHARPKHVFASVSIQKFFQCRLPASNLERKRHEEPPFKKHPCTEIDRSGKNVPSGRSP